MGGPKGEVPTLRTIALPASKLASVHSNPVVSGEPCAAAHEGSALALEALYRYAVVPGSVASSRIRRGVASRTCCKSEDVSPRGAGILSGHLLW